MEGSPSAKKLTARWPAADQPGDGTNWDAPEVAENISLEALEFWPALRDREIDAFAVFLKALTGQRYEHLILR